MHDTMVCVPGEACDGRNIVVTVNQEVSLLVCLEKVSAVFSCICLVTVINFPVSLAVDH